MVGINNSYVLGLFGGAANFGSGFAGYTPAPAKKDPTPPWATNSTAPRANDLVKRVMAGRSFIDMNAAQLDVKGAGQDYRKLFALYQGLNALHGLAERMDAKGVGSFEQGQIARRFETGLGQVADFIDGLRLDQLSVARGLSASIVKADVAMKRPTADYVGAVVHRGSSTDPVAAFQGDVTFSMNVQKTTTLSNGTVIDIGGPIEIQVDLAEMGATPRTLAAVTEFVNGKLADAGVATRWATERTAGQARKVVVNGREVTLSPEPDQYALKIKGSLGERLSFTAADSADAVYVVQQANTGDAARNQLLKFQSDVAAAGSPAAATPRPGETYWVEGRAFQVELGAAVETARAVATGPDGAVYVLADVDQAVAGQTLKGERDVALLKYDSAGRLIYARTLGASESASGYALAVDADGKVAVAGSVTGVLDKGDDGLDGAKSDSFVTVFDANGDELWTQRRGARAEDEAQSVSFGADGSVYVAGRARSAMPGADSLGGWDSYLQGFSPPASPGQSGLPKFATQFGSTGEDRATAMTMDGNAVLVGGVENGRAVVRRYALQVSGPPVLESVRDLGEIQGGEITGLAVQNGRLIVTGASGNASLSAGATTRAHSGGTDAFVAALETDLGASAADRLTWFGGAGADKATSAAFSGGQVWIAGTSPSSLPSTSTGDAPYGTVRDVEGFLARIDPLTGAIEYEKRFHADGNTAAPRAIAVGQGGASVLDRLGFPQGVIDGSDSAKVVAGTSVRAGDRFFVEGPFGRKAVVIEAADTLATLAKKIERAAGFAVTVSVAKDVLRQTDEKDPETAIYGAFERLQIKPRDKRSRVEISAGDLGTDALAALGLDEAVIHEKPVDASKGEPLYGLALSRNLRLDSKAGIKAALDAIGAALATVRTAYRDLVDAGKPKSPSVTGPAPLYLQNQLANYQAALDRLGG